MTNTSQKIVFFGTEEFSANSLEKLIEKGFDVQLVVTKPDTAKGRGRKISSPIVKQIAEKADIKVVQPSSLDEIVEDIKQLDQPAGVLVSFGKLIPQAVIDLFTPGIINVHPSLLPKYRGPSPIESAILNGDSQTGVSIMQLSSDMDAGPVYSQKTIKLTGNEDRLSAYKSLAALGAEELANTLPDILSGNIKPQPQDSSQASYCHLLTKKQSYLAPSSTSAEEMERHVRAFLGFPRSRCMLMGHEVIVLKAHVSDIQSQNVPQLIGCNGTFLSIDSLIGPSGKTMTGEAYLRGYAKD